MHGIPRILLILGDPSGIGPEISAKTAGDLPEEAGACQIVITGDYRTFEVAQQITGMKLDLPIVDSFDKVQGRGDRLLFWAAPHESSALVPAGETSFAAGRETLRMLRRGIELAKQKRISGLVYAPLSKEALHLVDSRHASELELFAEEFDRRDVSGELSIVDGLWVARVTSHIPIRNVADAITVAAVERTITTLGNTLVRSGLVPRIAVAALNPHGGEHGLFGDEESTVITPGIEAARRAHPAWMVGGPFPADTLFPRLKREGYNGAVGMYHDQIQIATKLIGLTRGVTFQPDMPVPIATPAHGTAFDLVGTGKADHHALKNALALVAAMACANSAK